MDTTLWAGEERPDIRAFVVCGVVPNHIDEAFVRIARLDLGKKLHGADAIHGGWFNKGRVEGFKVERAMDIDAPAPLRANSVKTDSVLTEFALVFGRHDFPSSSNRIALARRAIPWSSR